jgi:DNA-binding MarR family transcriptional regulator
VAEQQDFVDRIVSEWARSQPDLDVSPIEIIGRVSRLSRIIDRHLAENFAAHDIENWMYDVMATLRRIGPPHELSAGELVRQTMITTGAMTNRIDRLEQRGYVERVQSTQDRRSVTVRLTASGIRKVDAVATSHYELESQLLDALSATHRRTLGRLLRTMLVSLGDTDSARVV